MAVQLNHTIVRSHNQEASARFLTEILGLPEATRFGPFLVVDLDNDVSLDFYETDGAIASQHYAFLVTEAEFEASFARLRARDLDDWADPGQTRRGQIHHRDGGRGVTSRTQMGLCSSGSPGPMAAVTDPGTGKPAGGTPMRWSHGRRSPVLAGASNSA